MNGGYYKNRNKTKKIHKKRQVESNSFLNEKEGSILGKIMRKISRDNINNNESFSQKVKKRDSHHKGFPRKSKKTSFHSKNILNISQINNSKRFRDYFLNHWKREIQRINWSQRIWDISVFCKFCLFINCLWKCKILNWSRFNKVLASVIECLLKALVFVMLLFSPCFAWFLQLLLIRFEILTVDFVRFWKCLWCLCYFSLLLFQSLGLVSLCCFCELKLDFGDFLGILVRVMW